MQIQNPHAAGSVAHANFGTFVAHYAGQPQTQLYDKHVELTTASKNFLRYSCDQMSAMDFEAGVISRVHQEKFGSPL